MSGSASKHMSPSIFVSVASYRDPECHRTVCDLFEKAQEPARISVGICWQFISPQDDYMFEPLDSAYRVRSIGYDARSSLGACWAKSEAQKLWQGEDYVLNIDSHMRFEPGWDRRLIEILNSCPAPKPVLSTYPAPYEPPDRLFPGTPHLVAGAFGVDGVLHLEGRQQDMTCPKRGAFISGNFCFARAEFLAQVPHDPQLYFYGEEITLSVRAWTHGWDVFTPHVCVIYHCYGRPGVPKHWDDHPEWWRQDRTSNDRVKILLEESDMNQAGDQYGLGRRRTVSDFEAFSGVRFRDRCVLERARQGEFIEGNCA